MSRPRLLGQRATFFNLLSRRALLMVVVAGLLLVFAFAAPLWPPESSVRLAIFWLSALLIGLCVAGRTWAVLYIDGHKYVDLVTEGPYSVSRNPLYLFSFFGAAGAGAASGSLVLGVISLLATYGVFYALVRKEEDVLLELHGEAYSAYCQTVPRFWPRVGNWKPVPWVHVRPQKVVATFLEALLLVLVYPAFFVIGTGQVSGWLPVLIRLP